MMTTGPHHNQASRDKQCVMDDDSVRAARKLYESGKGYTQLQLATMFGVKKEYMQRVLNYELRTTVR